MFFRQAPRWITFGALLLGSVTLSHALTLGRARGVALIGRPIDLAVQVTLEGAGDLAAECVMAEVFQGDARLPSTGLTATLEEGARGEASLRVRSPTPVEDAVVTLYVRLGCAQPVTRRYVFLSELPGDLVSAPMAAAMPRSDAVSGATGRASVVRTQPAAALSPAIDVSAARVQGQVASVSQDAATPEGGKRIKRKASPAPAGAAPTPGAASAKPVPPEKSTERRPVLARKPEAARTRSRLVLDPFDLAAERDPVLKASTSLPETAEATAEQRAQAAALWKAVNARPEDVLRDTQSLSALEADLKSLRQQVLANNASLTEMRGQLEQARAERYANGVVYGLAILLAIALGGGYYAWRRERDQAAGSPAWWKAAPDPDEEDSTRMPLPSTVPPAAAPAPVSAPVSAPQAPQPLVEADDIDLDLSQPPDIGGPAPVAPAKRKRYAPEVGDSDFQASQPASMRSVKAEELHDIQQQADFFVSLGQHEQAIQVLIGHIHAHPRTSALAWLDLLDLYHNLDRRADFELLRRDFQRSFNVSVPGFDHYLKPRAGLDAHPAALARIVALWPSAKVLDVIEDALFRSPGADGAEPFGLETYRDLLMLYNVGKETLLTNFDDSDRPMPALDMPAHSDFGGTDLNPLEVSPPLRELLEPDFAAEPTSDFVDIPVGVDIDLADLPPEPTVDAATAAPSTMEAFGIVSAPAPLTTSEPVKPPPTGEESSSMLDFDAFDSATERFSLPKRKR